MSEWKITNIGDILTLQRGFDLPSDDRRNGTYPVVASTGIVGFHDQSMVKGPGVIIGRSGSIGGGQYIQTDFWPLNTTLWVKDFKGNNPRFCYYLLKSLDLSFLNAGSGVPTLNRNHVHPIVVPYPVDVKEQRAIAHILGTLDDKIEFNRRMNETLEGIARALFKSWFIDFDPVRAKAEGRQPFGMNEETAALFPSEFEDSELGEIPKGWKVECVESICDTIENGGTPNRMNKDYWNGQISWFKTGELNDGPLLSSEETISDDGLKSSACKVWPKGTVLVALYASPTVGRLGILEIEATANQACSALIAKPPFNHLFLFHSILFSRSRLQQIAVGAAQQNISQQVLRKHKILIPSEDIVTRYQDSCASLYHQIVNNKSNNLILSKLRDTLLPKLISGDLRVNLSNFGFVPD
jgi:type I restriction enzyme S subunit